MKALDRIWKMTQAMKIDIEEPLDQVRRHAAALIALSPKAQVLFDASFSPRLDSQLSERDSAYWNDPAFGTPTGDPTFGASIHYTELARQMRIFDPSRCRPATAQERERYRWRIVDGQLCSFAPRDHAATTDFESTPTSSTSERVAPMWRTRPDTRTGGEVLR